MLRQNDLSSLLATAVKPVIKYANMGYKPTEESAPLFAVRGRPTRTYVRIQEATGSTLAEAINVRGVHETYNLPVILEKSANNTWLIADIDPDRFEIFMSSNPVPLGVGIHTHRLLFGNPDFVETKRVESLLCRFRLNTVIVEVTEGEVVWNGIERFIPATTFSLATAITGITSGWAWVKTWMEPITGVVSATISGLQASAGGLTRAALAAMTNSGLIPLAGAKMASGDTFLQYEEYLVDLRPWITGMSGGGTVTSIALTMPAIFNVAGSPITGGGTLAVSLINESANLFLAGPTSGSAAAPTFRAVVPADLTTALTTPPDVGATTPGTGRFTNLRGDDLKIGTASLNAAAIAQFDTTTKGVLIPRLTTTQRDAITSPPNGLILYNTTTDKYTAREGGAWVEMGSGGGGHVIQDDGSDMTARAKLNFIGATVADNPGNDSTDIAVTGGGSGGSVTVEKESFQQRVVLYDNTLSSAGIWDVSSIDQTYDDLEIIVEIIASDVAQTTTEIAFNNDTTAANYTSILHEGSSGGSNGYVFTSTRRLYGVNAQDATTKLSPGYFRIPGYTGTTFHKTIHGISVNEGPTKYIDNIGVIWASTAAIDRIKITSDSGGNLATGSRLRIVGLKEVDIVTDVTVGALVATTKDIETRTALYDNTLSSDGTWDISSIDQTYDHLEIVASLRPSSGSSAYLSVQINGDTTAGSYFYDYIAGNNGVAGVYLAGDTPPGFMAYIADSTSPAGSYGEIRAFIQAYSSSKLKIAHVEEDRRDTSSQLQHRIVNWLWNSTAAINRITILPQSGQTYAAGSRLQIIGIKTEQVVIDVQGAYVNATNVANQNYALIKDQKMSGTNAGTFTSGADRTRDLNTIVTNMANPIVLSGNQIEIVVTGTYRISWLAPAFRVDTHQSLLYDISNSAELARGSSEVSVPSGSANTISHGTYTGEIAAGTLLEIRHQGASTQSTNGFGVAGGFGLEVYASVEIERLDTPTISLALGSATAKLSADVTMGIANTYYDGISLALEAGTWLINSAITMANDTFGTDYRAKLWDGTTAYTSGQTSRAVAGQGTSIALSWIVTLTTTTTVKISGAAVNANNPDGSNSKILAALSHSGAGNNATWIAATKIG